MTDELSRDELRDWITIEQLSEENPAFSIGWLRHRMFLRQENGLAPHVKKIGRRLVISRKGFVQWLKSYYDDQGVRRDH